MNRNREPLACFAFDGKIIEWRGPAPFLFIRIPDDHIAELRFAARDASYGWGVIPVEARIRSAEFTTSLFPRGQTYMLPIKVAVRKAARIDLGDQVKVHLRVLPR
jgi:hypothetical protein